MASFEIAWKRSASKELRKLPKKIVSRIVAAVQELADDPYPSGVRKLARSDHTYRIRISDYRVIYTVYDDQLVIEITRSSS